MMLWTAPIAGIEWSRHPIRLSMVASCSVCSSAHSSSVSSHHSRVLATIGVDLDDMIATRLCSLPAEPYLILNRGLSLIIRRISSVDCGTHHGLFRLDLAPVFILWRLRISARSLLRILMRVDW